MQIMPRSPAQPVTHAEAQAVLNEVTSLMLQIGTNFQQLFMSYHQIVSKIIVTRRTQTADVNASGTVRINPDFWNSLDPTGQRKYLVLHEVMHPLCSHLNRRGARDPGLWNVACDAVINTILDTAADDQGRPLFKEDEKIPSRITLPAGFSTDPDDLCTEKVYDHLLKNKPPEAQKPPPPPGPGDDEDEDDGGIPGEDGEPGDEEGEDDQDSDQDGEGEPGEGEGEPGDEEGEGEPGGEGEGASDGEPGEGEGEGEASDEEGEPGEGGGGMGPMTEEELRKAQERARDEQTKKGAQPKPGTGCGLRETTDKEDVESGEIVKEDMANARRVGNPVDLLDPAAIDNIIDQATSLENITSSGGQGKGGNGGIMGTIGRRDGRVDWKRLLRNLIAAEVTSGSNQPTYSRMSRRGGIDPQIIKQGTVDERVHVGVLMDVSGSVPRDWVERSVGEIAKIAKAYPKAHLWAAAHTSEVIGPVIIQPDNARECWRVLASLAANSGGTDCVDAYRLADEARPKLDVLIHFTDGEISPWPVPSVKRLIVIIVGQTSLDSVENYLPKHRKVETFLATDDGARP